MALPVEFNTGRLTGHYVDLAGVPMSGQVGFTASPTVFIAASSDTVVVPIELVVQLDSNGRFQIDLPATDDEDITPTAWTYTVKEVFLGFTREYPIQVPVGSTQDVTEINPVSVSPGVITTRGPRGRSILDAIVDGNGHLIISIEGTTGGVWTMEDAGYVLGNAASETAFNGFAARMDNVESQLTTGTSNATANTFMRRDNSANSAINILTAAGVELTADPASANRAARKSYVDALVAPLTNATDAALGGSLVKRDTNASVSFNQTTITAPAPTAISHATRKDYVDAADTALSGRISTLETANTAATASPTANTLAKRDANGRMQVANGSASGDIINLGQANGLYLGTAARDAASGVAALDGGRRVLGTGLDIAIGAAPSSPGAGTLRWYVSNADSKGQIRIMDNGGLIRRANMDWGAAGSLPSAGDALRGDTTYHTGMATMFIFNGTSWRQADQVTVVANAAARTALSTNFVTLMHHNFCVFETDTSRLYRWVPLSNLWEYVTGGSTPRIQVPLSAGWQNYGGIFETVAYYRSNGIVFMTGLLQNVNAINAGSYTFVDAGGLPVGYRPQAQTLWTIIHGNNTVARMDALPNGRCDITTSVQTNANFYFGINAQWAAAT